MNSSKKMKRSNDSIVFLFQLVAFSFFSLLLFSCTPEKKLIIPQEPTIWVVSEIYEPNEEKFNGMVGYKIIPVNPGNINARPTWKLDHKGKYEVGQKVDFSPVLDKKTASK